jgi:putative holliday junction resolvase
LGRILAIDYGKKRVGIAVSDPLQMIANRLTTVASNEIIQFLKDYFEKEKVDCVVIGFPVQLNNQPSDSQVHVSKFISIFAKQFPQIPIEKYDERFTSSMAMQTMIDGGVKKKKRQDKALVDGISATIILQDFLRSRENKKERF